MEAGVTTTTVPFPLHDVEAVEYRHQILRDMDGEALCGALAEFADRMRDMRNQERMP
jgi:hypothetical protein